MNKAVLIGRNTKEIELRATKSGSSVTAFTIAVNRDFKNANGETEADFINCVAYGKTAELLSKYVKKGDRLAVEGRIQVRNYDNQEGKKVYVTEVIVQNIEFLESKQGKKEEVSAPTPAAEKTTNDPFKEFGEELELTDADLPF